MVLASNHSPDELNDDETDIRSEENTSDTKINAV
jgi:multidrug efflux pump